MSSSYGLRVQRVVLASVVGFLLAFFIFQGQIFASLDSQESLQNVGDNHSHAYSQKESFGLMKFWASRFDQGRFSGLLRFLEREGVMEVSHKKTYGVYFQDLSSLESEWRRSLDVSRST